MWRGEDSTISSALSLLYQLTGTRKYYPRFCTV
ncbi:hypothetical protein, partial [Escherichia coli]